MSFSHLFCHLFVRFRRLAALTHSFVFCLTHLVATCMLRAFGFSSTSAHFGQSLTHSSLPSLFFSPRFLHTELLGGARGPRWGRANTFEHTVSVQQNRFVMLNHSALVTVVLLSLCALSAACISSVRMPTRYRHTILVLLYLPCCTIAM